MPLKTAYGEIPTSPIKMFPSTALHQKEYQNDLLGQRIQSCYFYYPN